MCLLKTAEVGLGRERKGQRRAGAGGAGVPRHHHQGPVQQGRQADAVPCSQEVPSPKSRKHLPAQRFGQVQGVRQGALRLGRQERPVLLLRLPVDHEARQGRLRYPQTQRPPLRADDRRQDSLQHPHRGEHHRAGEGGGRGDGRHSQRKKLRTVEDELEDVKRRLGRIWNAIETSDIDIADASDRIKEHRERKERLEDAAADARAILSQRRAYLDDVSTIAAYARDMKDFLQESELTERRAFIDSFVKEIIVIPGDALIRYTIPISQSTQKTELFLGGRFGHNQVRSGGSTGGRATSTLIAGSIPHRWALLDG